MEKLDQEQLTEVFDIKKQPIKNIDRKEIEELQKKFIVKISLGWHSKSTPFFMKTYWFKKNNNDANILDFNDTSLRHFSFFIDQVKAGKDRSWTNIYSSEISSNINSRNLLLFKIEQAFIKEWFYFFYTSDWKILTADKDDFDSNWIYAESLRFFRKDDVDYLWKTDNIFYFNSLKAESTWDWFIHFYKNWKHILDIPGENIFQIDSTNFLVSNEWKLQQYKPANDNEFKRWDTFDIPYKWVTQMFVDYNKNFLFIVNESDEWSTLHIISYNDYINDHEINEIYSIKNVKKVCGLWEKNWMICLMSDNSLQYYRNTFSKFRRNFFEKDENWNTKWKLIYPKDEQITTITDSRRSDLLKSLEDWTISINFDENIEDETDKIDHDIIDKIWNIKISDNGETLKEMFDKSNDEESITLVWKIFQKIKKNPQIAKVEWITKSISEEILNKKNKIILDSIFSELWDITEELWEDPDLATLITIKDKLKTIKKKRWGIQAWNWFVSQDKELKSLLEITDKKILEYKEIHKEELEEEIVRNLEKIESFLNDIENAIDISSIYATPLYQTVEDLISCLDKDWQETFQKKLKNLVQWRLDELKEISNKWKKEEAEIMENKKKKAEEYINQIKEILDEIDDIDKIEQIRENDALVQKLKDLLSEIPSSEAQLLDLKLDKIFGERIFTLRLNWEELKWVIQNLDTYWIDTLLYYDEDGSEQVDWKIEWKERSDWKIGLIIKLMNGETHEYDKSLYLRDFEKYGDVTIRDWNIKFDMNEEEFAQYSRKLSKWKKTWKKEIQDLSKEIFKETDSDKRTKLQKRLSELKEYYKDARYTNILIDRLIKQQKLNPRSKVPPFDPDYIVLDEEKEILKRLSTRLVDQKHNSGIEILEWWPWLWKTVMCEFLASVTNREIVRVQCSKMDPSDMFFSPTLKKWETSREPADWIKLMQKPGTIILFDEIDKLNDQCFERLHSLFDRGRSVYDPQLWKVKANPDCLFLWTRNSYDRLSNPILSRWRILQINYPPVLNEAFKISKYSDSSILKKMSYEEFGMLYDKYITRWEQSPNNVYEKKIYDLIININHLLNVFTELRNLYDSDEPFAFELSYRDARQIFVDYNNSWDFRKSMENILVPKARWAVIDTDDKKTQEDMVMRAIESEF